MDGLYVGSCLFRRASDGIAGVADVVVEEDTEDVSSRGAAVSPPRMDRSVKPPELCTGGASSSTRKLMGCVSYRMTWS